MLMLDSTIYAGSGEIDATANASVDNFSESYGDYGENFTNGVERSRNTWLPHPSQMPKQLFWVMIDVILLIIIVLGNVLTILAVRFSRRLRNVTSNQLILSLAISDLIVGVSLLYHLFFFLSDTLSSYKVTCLLRFVLLSIGCCAGFCNVTSIAIDRYVAIIHPLKYPEYVTERVTFVVIGVNWCTAIFIATIPTYWNNLENYETCELDTVIPRYYTFAILAPLFVTVWLTIFGLYWRIWREAETHAQRWKRNDVINFDCNHWKSIQVVLLILGCFSLCWFPYVIVAIARVIDSTHRPSPTIYRVMFSIAMANSGVNPMIYAWKNPSFRKAFHRLLKLKSPDYNDYNSSFKNYLRKQSELSKREFELEARNEFRQAYVLKGGCERLDKEVKDGEEEVRTWGVVDVKL